ncbi:MAG: ATP-binding protein [Gammaproteobacteria bacterium]|jgi:cell division protein FtsX|nr:ATP-binding protein [Gammaproteobacteria bacterium]
MNIKLVDVTLHIDEDLNAEQRETIKESLRALDGVVSVHNPEKTPHLTIVEYDPDENSSKKILQRVRDQGAHAEIVGL